MKQYSNVLHDGMKAGFTENGSFSCTRCGFTDKFKSGEQPACPKCDNRLWLASLQTKRIS